MEKGIFLSFCGLDGAGKTTHATLLKEYIESRYDKKVNIVQGYKPPIHIKNLQEVADKHGIHYQKLFTSGNVTMSLLLDLWEHTRNIIIPALNKGEVVIAERYWESSLLYAPILGVDEDFIKKIVSQFIRPDAFIFLDITPQKSFSRVIKRAESENVEIMPKENLDIMLKVADSYKNFAKNSNAIQIEIDTDDRRVVSERIINELEARNIL